MSWLFSQALVEEFSAGRSWAGEPCAPLNLMPSPQPFLHSDKTMDYSPPSQFGLTLGLFAASRGARLLMSYLVDFRVRTLAQRERAQVSRVSDPACGWKWPASFVKYDPASRSWKTRQSSLLGGLESFSETWPRWGSMLDGECLALTTPAPPHERDRIWIVAHADSQGLALGKLLPGIRRQTKWREPRETACVGGEMADPARLLEGRQEQRSERERVGAGCESLLPDASEHESDRREEGPGRGSACACAACRGSRGGSHAGADWWLTEPNVGRVADGVADRVDRLKAIGNGQVPAVAALAWRTLTQAWE